MLRGWRERVQERGLRLLIVLPNFVARRRSGLDLCGQKLLAGLRHAVSGIHNRSGRSLGRLSEAPLRSMLRESRTRLEGAAARLESVLAAGRAPAGLRSCVRRRGPPTDQLSRRETRRAIALCASPTARWVPPRTVAAPPIARAACRFNPPRTHLAGLRERARPGLDPGSARSAG